MSPRTGVGQVIRTPAPSSGSAWRGLSLRNTSAATFAAVDFQPFNTLLTQTDGIRSTITYTFGPITVGIGSAGVVPAGMAGPWRLAANNNFSGPVGGLDNVEFDLVVNNFSPFILSDHEASPFPSQCHLAIAPLVVELAEGDVVWCDVYPVTGTSIDAGYDATLLMEFLG